MLTKPTTLNKRYNQDNYLVQTFEEFIKYLEKKSSNVWTDYNDSDIGIALMEYVIFALYDIKYRLRLPILNYFNEDFRNDIELYKFFILQNENSSDLIIQRLGSVFDNFPIEVTTEKYINISNLICKSESKINRNEKVKLSRYLTNLLNKYRVMNTEAFVIDLQMPLENNNTQVRLKVNNKKSFQVKEFVTDYRSIQEDLPEVYGFSVDASRYKKYSYSDKLALHQFRSFILLIDYFLADTLLSVNRIKKLIDFEEDVNRYQLPELLAKGYSSYFASNCGQKECIKDENINKCKECKQLSLFIRDKTKIDLKFKESFLESLFQYFDFDIHELYGPYLKKLADKDCLEILDTKYKLFKKGIEYKAKFHLGPNLIYESSTNSFIKVLNKNFKSLRPKTKLGFEYEGSLTDFHADELIDMTFLREHWFYHNCLNINFDKKTFDFDDFDELKKYNFLISKNLLRIDWVDIKIRKNKKVLTSSIHVVPLDNKYYYATLEYKTKNQDKFTYAGFHWQENEAIRHAQLFNSFIHYLETESLDDFSLLIETRFLCPNQKEDLNADILIVLPIREHESEHEVIQFTDNIINKYFPMHLDVRMIKVTEAKYREIQPYYRGWRRAIANHIRKKTDIDYDDYSIARFYQIILNIYKDASS